MKSYFINAKKQIESNGLKLLSGVFLIFTIIIIIGNSLLYINYSLKFKYEVDLIRYKQENLSQLSTSSNEIQGILGLSKIVFVYTFSIFFFLIFILVYKFPSNTKNSGSL